MVRSIVRRIMGLRCLEDYTIEERRKMWPEAMPLKAKHICNCKMLENREIMLEHMPKNSTSAEIGIWRCDFSEKILKVTEPAKLHLIDIDIKALETAKKRFAREISSGLIELHHGDSSETISSMPDKYFDWIYIDGDHSYKGVKSDYEIFWPRLTRGGFMVFHDVLLKNHPEHKNFGVWRLWAELPEDNKITIPFTHSKILPSGLGVLQKK